MRQIATAAPVIIASYPKVAGEEQLRPSPFLEKLKPAKLQACAGWMEEMAVACEEIEDAKGPSVTNHGIQQGGAHVLRNQAACPFRAFATHRLGAGSLDDAELGVSPRDHGNAAHKAMEMFWSEVSSHQALIDHPDFAQLILDCVDRALDQHTHKRSGTPPWFLEVEQERLQRVMEAWIKYERVREPFTVVHSEQQQLIEIGGLRLEIRPDRIDRYEDGSYAVLDYKTAKIVRKDMWEGARLDEPQLPLYAVKLAQNGNQVREIMLARLATGIKKQSDMTVSQTGAELQANLILWKQILETLAANFAAGEAAIAPKPPGKVCNQCDFGPICRIEKKRGEDDDNG